MKQDAGTRAHSFLFCNLTRLINIRHECIVGTSLSDLALPPSPGLFHRTFANRFFGLNGSASFIFCTLSAERVDLVNTGRTGLRVSGSSALQWLPKDSVDVDGVVEAVVQLE